jgi:hypothetical protein
MQVLESFLPGQVLSLMKNRHNSTIHCVVNILIGCSIYVYTEFLCVLEYDSCYTLVVLSDVQLQPEPRHRPKSHNLGDLITEVKSAL